MRTVYVFAVRRLEDDLLEVEDDVADVLDDVGDGGELVQRALDADGRDGRALERGEQHAAERVADRDAEAALERLAGELARRSRSRVSVSIEMPFGRMRSRQLRAIMSCDVGMSCCLSSSRWVRAKVSLPGAALDRSEPPPARVLLRVSSEATLARDETNVHCKSSLTHQRE